eukprot:INCI2765.1.p1 GENE.INCI2765.1~~INCI2765.1.p1  ORF type:complete len:438 (+),score=82.65 INCI2765.1:276-1589(+)
MGDRMHTASSVKYHASEMESVRNGIDDIEELKKQMDSCRQRAEAEALPNAEHASGTRRVLMDLDEGFLEYTLQYSYLSQPQIIFGAWVKPPPTELDNKTACVNEIQARMMFKRENADKLNYGHVQQASVHRVMQLSLNKRHDQFKQKQKILKKKLADQEHCLRVARIISIFIAFANTVLASFSSEYGTSNVVVVTCNHSATTCPDASNAAIINITMGTITAIGVLISAVGECADRKVKAAKLSQKLAQCTTHREKMRLAHLHFLRVSPTELSHLRRVCNKYFTSDFIEDENLLREKLGMEHTEYLMDTPTFVEVFGQSRSCGKEWSPPSNTKSMDNLAHALETLVSNLSPWMRNGTGDSKRVPAEGESTSSRLPMSPVDGYSADAANSSVIPTEQVASGALRVSSSDESEIDAEPLNVETLSPDEFAPDARKDDEGE